MTIYFLDSSALAKRYVTEIGTGWVKSITDRRSGHTIIVAQFTQVEIVSAITRRQREGAVTPRTLRAIRLLVDRHASREYTVVAVSVSIIQRAETLLEKHPLRAYDSLS